MRRVWRPWCLLFLAGGWTLGAQAWTVVVNSAQDNASACATSGSGTCSLRDALAYANANRNTGDANRIEFAIGSGDQTISLTSALPALLAPQSPATSLTLDATTQPGYGASSPLRPLITLRPSTSFAGLSIAGATTLKGLAIGGFYAGITISGDNNTVLGCHVGVDAAGTSAMGNALNISVAGNGNRIGDLSDGGRNIISAATQTYGVNITSGSGNTVQGNYIGTDITGTVGLGNTYEGIRVQGAGNNLIDSNLVSANSPGLSYNAGVAIRSSGNTITRNRIGSNAAGTATLGAQAIGIDVAFSDAGQNRIGTGAADGNLIVGSLNEAIMVQGNSPTAKATGNSIIGNTIGTTADASAVLANSYGITLSNTNASVVRGNTIAGSAQAGITVQGDSSGTLIQGNFIGTNANGAVLPNRYGIAFFGSAHDNTVGGLAAQEANAIANHALWGVVLYSDGVYNTSILGNSIYRNASGGIAATAVANHAQTAPVLTALTAGSVTGTLDSVANEMFRIEYFATPHQDDDTPDAAAGKRLLGSMDVSTDGTGHAALTYSDTVPAGYLETITATATRLSTGDTSRYSTWMALNSAPQAQPQSLFTAQNTALPITLTGTDLDGDALTYAVVDAPAHGALEAFDPVAGTLRYTPAAGYAGADAFSFTVNDGSLDSTKVTVAITVIAQDDNGGSGSGSGSGSGATVRPVPSLHTYAVLALGLLLAGLGRRLLVSQQRSRQP